MYADVVWKNSFEVLVDLMTQKSLWLLCQYFHHWTIRFNLESQYPNPECFLVPQIVKNTLLSFSIITVSSFFSNTILYNQVKETAGRKVVQFCVDCIWGSMQEIMSIPKTLNMFGTIFWLQLEANP
jgi:hypothetical protein